MGCSAQSTIPQKHVHLFATASLLSHILLTTSSSPPHHQISPSNYEHLHGHPCSLFFAHFPFLRSRRLLLYSYTPVLFFTKKVPFLFPLSLFTFQFSLYWGGVKFTPYISQLSCVHLATPSCQKMPLFCHFSSTSPNTRNLKKRTSIHCF